jgi:hypothetical protein
MRRLSKIEKTLRDLVEGALGDIFQTKTLSQQIARVVLDAMQEGLELHPDGRVLAPDSYLLYMHPTSARKLKEEAPKAHQQLLAALQEEARIKGIFFLSKPEIQVIEDRNFSEDGTRVKASISRRNLESTKEMGPTDERQTGTPPTGAFMIVEGKRHVALLKAVVYIGRRQDNDLVLNDPQVSRIHALLRVKDRRFVLFDLGSSHGTQVNNRAVQEHILQAGDVIRIGSIRMVYGEDPSNPADDTPTYQPSEEGGRGLDGSKPHRGVDASGEHP